MRKSDEKIFTNLEGSNAQLIFFLPKKDEECLMRCLSIFEFDYLISYEMSLRSVDLVRVWLIELIGVF